MLVECGENVQQQRSPASLVTLPPSSRQLYFCNESQGQDQQWHPGWRENNDEGTLKHAIVQVYTRQNINKIITLSYWPTMHSSHF